MGDAHDAEPVVAGALAQADAVADAGGEDLAAAAGDRVEARLVPKDQYAGAVGAAALPELDKLRARRAALLAAPP